MDIFTFFAVTMVVLAAGAILLAVLNLHYARHEIAAHRQFLKLWFDRVAEEYDAHKLTHGKTVTALADRVRNLETYRRNHAERLSGIEDTLSADHKSEPGCGQLEFDDHETALQHRDFSPIDVMPELRPRPRTRLVDSDEEILASRQQAQIERRFLQGP